MHGFLRLMGIRLSALLLLLAMGLALGSPFAFGQDIVPQNRLSNLTRHDIDLELKLDEQRLVIRQKIHWKNPTKRTLTRMVFNAHARYVVPSEEVPAMAKTLELLRMRASEVLGVNSPQLEMAGVRDGAERLLKFRFGGSTKTDLEVELIEPLLPGQTQCVELAYSIRMENKQGRWGHWKNVWFLAQGLVQVAMIRDIPEPGEITSEKSVKVLPFPEVSTKCLPLEDGWDPAPFYPWHQPFSNDSAHYRVRSVSPSHLEVATSGHEESKRDLGDNRTERIFQAKGLRDFSWFASQRFHWFTDEAITVSGKRIPIRVAAFHEHSHYAKRMTQIAKNAVETYSKWLGDYPWEQFTLAESYFGWNGNECGALVMIDERVFDMPHLADGFVDYLVSHEVCHQWFYNLVGTDGVREPFMDEGLATSLSHLVMDKVHGRDHRMLEYPVGLKWLPPIQRDDYRNQGLRAMFAKGGDGAIRREMGEYGNIAQLFNMAYDKASKVFDLIRERMGESAWIEFLRHVVKEYSYRQLSLKDFRRELESFTGRDWGKFFEEWFEGPGHTDWSLADVKVLDSEGAKRMVGSLAIPELLAPAAAYLENSGPVRVRIRLHREGNREAKTTLAVRMDEEGKETIRVPIHTDLPKYTDPTTGAEVEVDGDDVIVELALKRSPMQVVVDPDKIQIDPQPGNNYWRKPLRLRFTPVYTLLEEMDLTNNHDRLNLIAGPWLYTAPYSNPWYTRPTMAGFRVGTYQTREFSAGAYAAYRTDYRDFVAGIDGLFAHWPDGQSEVGYHAETRIGDLQDGSPHPTLASLYTRRTFMPTASLYQRPTEYMESFLNYSGNFLPYPVVDTPGAMRYNQYFSTGLHLSRYYQIPYWDPEAGYQFNLGVEGGAIDLNSWQGMGRFWGNYSFVTTLPDFTHWLPFEAGQGFRWVGEYFAQSRFAARAYGGFALPSQAQIFSMGGGELFRGYSLSQRQGSGISVISGEWRLPIIRQCELEAFDRVVGLRNLYGAVFCDTGNVWVSGKQVGPWATAVGAGIRADLSFLGFLERGLVRLDVAQALDSSTGVQVWFGLNQPF